jgi:hypothetical protein
MTENLIIWLYYRKFKERQSPQPFKRNKFEEFFNFFFVYAQKSKKIVIIQRNFRKK